MPEGPEVRIVAERLHKLLAGKKYVSITPIGGSIKSSTRPIHANFRDEIAKLNNIALRNDAQLKFTRVLSKGKYIYFELQLIHKLNGTESIGYKYIGNHLMLTGRWTDVPDNASVELVYEGGSIYFTDTRQFGYLEVLTQKELRNNLDQLGPNVLDTITIEQFKERINMRPRAAIASVLSDQSILSGIGNYLRSDILWKARIDPKRASVSFKESEWKALHAAVASVPQDSYKKGGSFDYVDDGKYKMLIYKKKEDPLGNKVTFETIGGQRVYKSSVQK